MNTSPRAVIGAAALVASLTLAGCGSDSDGASDSTTTAVADGSGSSSETAAALTAQDTWAKATDDEMSAVFGVLRNTTGEDVTIVSATSDVTEDMELHETVMGGDGEMMMQEKSGGFVVPAGGELELQPGANHLMLLGLEAPIVAGDEVAVTLTLGDGSTIDFTAVAKDYSGANENYEEGEDGMDMGADMGTDMGSDSDAG